MNFRLLIIPIITITISCSNNLDKSEINNDESILGFQIIGEVDSSIREVALFQYENGGMIKFDSSEVKDNHFTFKGELFAPEVYYLQFKDGDLIPVFMENSTVKIHVKGLSKDSIKIEGSRIHDEWSLIESEIFRYDVQLDSISTLYYNANDNDLKLEMIRYEVEYDSIEKMKENYIEGFISENSASYITPYLIIKYKLNLDNSDALKSLLIGLDNSIKNSPYIELINERIDQLNLSKVGNTIPSFSLRNSINEDVSIEDFRGQYVLIDFWASWCGPCRSENPNVVKAYNKYKQKGFTVLGISLDTDKDAWLKAISDDKLNWTHISDLQGWKNETAQKFGVRSIPFSILIDPEGIILAKNLRAQDLHEELEKQLNK